MKLANIRKIIELNGITIGDSDSAFFHIKIENEPWMPLTIEGIGTGPHGYPAISVCHYREEGGDLIQDPEMMFEWFSRCEPGTGEFMPYAIQLCTGRYAEVYVTDESGKVTAYRPGEKKDQEYFARMWNTNIGHQGFVKAAKLAGKKAA